MEVDHNFSALKRVATLCDNTEASDENANRCPFCYLNTLISNRKQLEWSRDNASETDTCTSRVSDHVILNTRTNGCFSFLDMVIVGYVSVRIDFWASMRPYIRVLLGSPFLDDVLFQSCVSTTETVKLFDDGSYAYGAQTLPQYVQT